MRGAVPAPHYEAPQPLHSPLVAHMCCRELLEHGPGISHLIDQEHQGSLQHAGAAQKIAPLGCCCPLQYASTMVGLLLPATLHGRSFHKSALCLVFSLRRRTKSSQSGILVGRDPGPPRAAPCDCPVYGRGPCKDQLDGRGMSCAPHGERSARSPHCFYIVRILLCQ